MNVAAGDWRRRLYFCGSSIKEQPNDSFYIESKITKPTGQELEAVNLLALTYEFNHLSFDLSSGEVTRKGVTPLGQSTDQIKRLSNADNPLLEKITIEYKKQK